MPHPNLVTKGETMASSHSQELPWLRELAMVSPLVIVANVVLDKHGLGRYMAKSHLTLIAASITVTQCIERTEGIRQK